MTKVRSVRLSDEDVECLKSATNCISLSDAIRIMIGHLKAGNLSRSRRHYESIPENIFLPHNVESPIPTIIG